MQRRRLIILSISLIVLIVGGAFFVSPYMAIRGARKAAESGDAERLARYVDFPAVQESVEGALMSMVLQEMDAEDHTMSDLEAAIVGAFVHPVVQILISPAGLAAMLHGRAPEFDEAPAMPMQEQALIKMRYRGVNRFAVILSDGGEALQTISLVFRRKGLSWHMNAIELKGL